MMLTRILTAEEADAARLEAADQFVDRLAHRAAVRRLRSTARDERDERDERERAADQQAAVAADRWWRCG